MYRLEVEDLGKHFGRRVIFRRLSFELAVGEALAVTGANGSGKSTLVRMLAGVLSASKGELRLRKGEERIAPEQRPLYTGLVAPYLNVYDGLTARENLRFIANARASKEAAGRIGEVLERVGLGTRGDDLVGTYSSGMKQRAKLAAAILMEPPLLLLDEPSSNLDTEGIRVVEAVMARQRERGLLVVATNDADEAAKCDRAIRIEEYKA